ncbi:hypothetical protein D3C86_1096580 [compost metagenome]
MDSVITISEMKDVIILHPRMGGYGYMLQINGDWGQIAQFKRLCKEINERMSIDPDAPFTLIDKNRTDESFTTEFMGGSNNENAVVTVSREIAKEMKLPMVII